MITAESITSYQIDQVWRIGCNDSNPDVMHAATAAKAKHSIHCGAVMCSTLCESPFSVEETWNARAYCAGILEARTKEQP